MRIFYASEGEADITAGPAELAGIGDAIRELAASGESEFRREAECEGDPSPFDRLLTGLVVRKGPHRVNVFVVDDVLTMDAATDCLAELAEYFAYDETAQYPEHGHLE